MVSDWAVPTIDLERCTSCGLCLVKCPPRAVEMPEAYPAVVRPEDCSYCGDCENICPEGAIRLEYEIVLPPDTGENT